MSVSVVIPAWNAAATIGEALESIAGQTRPAGEVILVDDGSTDATVEIARGAQPGLRVVRQERAGTAAALNRGVEAARGDWLAFLDADDRWPANRLALQQGWLERDPRLEAVLGRVDAFLCRTAEPAAARRYRLPDPGAVAWLTGALLVRRDAFLRVGRFAEDLVVGFAIDWFDRARAAGLRLAIPEETVLERRVRPGSLSHRSVRNDRAYLETVRRALARRRGAAGPLGG
jgi:glycosyltransferase involved in cell wall biosynthesis